MVTSNILSTEPECANSDSPVTIFSNSVAGSASSEYSVIDLCSGMGGLSAAAASLQMEILAAVDTNAEYLRTFAKNFPLAETINETVCGTRAIQGCKRILRERKIDNSALVVLSGPPCQGFSAAGSRDPADKRNKVFVGVARAIIELRPGFAVIENVAAILREEHAFRVRDFTKRLEAKDYCVFSFIADAKDYGVAQRRKRAFFIVARNSFNERDFLRRLSDLQQAELSADDVLRGLPLADVRPERYDDEADVSTIANHLTMRHSASVVAKIARLAPGTGPMSYRRLHPDRPANTLFSGHRAPPAHYLHPRSITVREAARLQGFLDGFRIYGSFGNQMEQVTNAVPPPLAAAVIKTAVEVCGPFAD
jgi:DNA (cytosine-5)-methyltransferase 1